MGSLDQIQQVTYVTQRTFHAQILMTLNWHISQGMSERIHELLRKQHYQAESLSTAPTALWKLLINERQSQSQHKELKRLQFLSRP